MIAVAPSVVFSHRLLAGAPEAFRNFSRSIRPTTTTLQALTRVLRDTAGKTDRFAREVRGATSSVARIRADATSASGSVTKLGRSTAHRGVKSFGDKAGKSKGTLGKLAQGVGGILTLLLPLLPVTDILTKLMENFGTVMAIAAVAMTGINLAMRANPIGFLIGILLPVAAWLIEFAMNSETGQKIMKQVFDQALKGFQSVWKFLQPIITLIGQAVGTYFKGYIALFTAALKIIGSGISGFSNVRSSVTSASNALRGIASSTIGGIRNSIQPLLSFFTSTVPGFFRTAKDAFSGALRGIGDLIKGALSTVIGVVKGPINGLIAFANWIIDGLNELSFELLGKKFGVDLDKIPMLAEGGVVFPGSTEGWRIDPLTVLENRRVPAVTEAPRQPRRIREFHEKQGAGPRSTAEDLLFLAGAHC
ncbi:tape-measure protein [Streptomyces sp. NPDC012769]|uniref:tape-measure protein n=1 Tax=Streptomyces sp. NPDC012769 TaxID=3364848 RepID=UPI003694BA15